MDLVDGLLVVCFLGCFVGASVLAMVEVSLLRVRRSRVVVDAEQGDAGARRLLTLLDDLPVVLNTVLLLVLFCQVGAATIGGFLAQQWFGRAGVTAASILVTLLLFVYAEAIPKTLAVKAPDQRARRAAPPLAVIVGLFRPVIGGLLWLADLQSPSGTGSGDPISEEELRMMARESARAGAIGESDAVLVDRSFEFGDQRVADVMVGRSDIVSVDARRSAADAVNDAVTAGHRRLPVHRDGLDDVIGVVRLRDVVRASRSVPESTVEAVMTEILRCRPDEPISGLLRRMQLSGTWIALVADAAGRTCGLVTVEDVVAELMGEIAD